MKLDNNMTKLISDLEYIIGDSCYNPNSYDGYTGDEGCEFRYPVWYELDGVEHKTRGRIARETQQAEAVDSAFYKFGSNHLNVGDAVIKILKELEERYGIDIYKLEMEYRNK